MTNKSEFSKFCTLYMKKPQDESEENEDNEDNEGT